MISAETFRNKSTKAYKQGKTVRYNWVNTNTLTKKRKL